MLCSVMITWRQLRTEGIRRRQKAMVGDRRCTGDEDVQMMAMLVMMKMYR